MCQVPGHLEIHNARKDLHKRSCRHLRITAKEGPITYQYESGDRADELTSMKTSNAIKPAGGRRTKLAHPIARSKKEKGS